MKYFIIYCIQHNKNLGFIKKKLTLTASRIILCFRIKSNILLFLQAVNNEIFNKLIISENIGNHLEVLKSFKG